MNDKGINSLGKLLAKTEGELALVEKKLQDVYADCSDPELDCILVILSSTHSPI